jgi:hypothetical protein
MEGAMRLEECADVHFAEPVIGRELIIRSRPLMELMNAIGLVAKAG